MYEFLEEFEKRMEIVGIAQSIIRRKNRNMAIENQFDDYEFINLVFSVLVYIMELSLSEESRCDIKSIQRFLDKILKEYYNKTYSQPKLESFTDYIIKNVLQNEGEVYYFGVMNYSKGSMESVDIRLIADSLNEINGEEEITYSLTDQGYDFLFRTKEVDQEIQLTVEELKLKELIKRKNFKKAFKQSQDLVQMVRQKKNEIMIFMKRIRENVNNAEIDKFETLINSTFNLLDEEYDLLGDVMKMSKKSEDKIKEEYEKTGRLDEQLRNAQVQIRKINDNIKKTLSEQRQLILNRQKLSNVYEIFIEESFLFSMEKRYDIEKEILNKMEKHTKCVDEFWKLLNPLFMPNLTKSLNVGSVYQPQGMLKLDEEEKEDYIEKEKLSEDVEKIKIERVNQIYIEILDYIISYAIENTLEYSLQDIISNLKNNEEWLNRLTEDRLFFTTILKLYDLGYIDIAKWRKTGGRAVMNLTEELNLEYCLYKLSDMYEYMKNVVSISIEKIKDETVEFEIKKETHGDENIIEKIEISNFLIKVMTDER